MARNPKDPPHSLHSLVQNLTEIINLQQQALVAMNKRLTTLEELNKHLEAGAKDETNKQVVPAKGDSESRTERSLR